MNKIILTFGIVILVIFTSNAQYTGNDLLRGCKYIVRSENGEELDGYEAVQVSFWLGYLSGHTDSKVVQEKFCSKIGPYCFPSKGVENQQIARIVIKYLEDNPEKLHYSARLLLGGALVKYFPCEQ
ncbi:MAG: hypothetical protein JW913_12600 [Chitinispirillaceae bacterium]|nr:hypothetical protein [Chitinispirillaceae bacterium]